MKKIIFSLIICMCLGYTTLAKSVFNLVVDGKSVCTAAAVTGSRGERILLTAGHCSENITYYSDVYALDAETGDKYPVRLLQRQDSWPTTDYTIFGYTSRVPVDSLLTADYVPAVGESISVIEGPVGLMPFYVVGYYAGRVKVADRKDEVDGMYWIQIPLTDGASGAPVLDRNGRVWGIVVGKNSFLHGLALVVKIPIGVYGLGK